ncbi:MAG: hypothetical protein ACFB0D_23215 [Phormidesmis sp.]
MKLNAFIKNLLNSAIERAGNNTTAQNATAQNRPQVGATTVAGRPPRPDVNQGGWPGNNA